MAEGYDWQGNVLTHVMAELGWTTEAEGLTQGEGAVNFVCGMESGYMADGSPQYDNGGTFEAANWVLGNYGEVGDYSYQATVMDEEGNENEVTIDECQGVADLLAGKKPAYGIRINGVKYMKLREQTGVKYDLEGDETITLDRVIMLKKGNINTVVAALGDYALIGVAAASFKDAKGKEVGVGHDDVAKALALGLWYANQ